MPTFQAAVVPDGTNPELKKYLQGLNARIAEYGAQVQQAVNGVIDRKHAPILIPAVTIDAAHGTMNVTAASAGSIFTNFNVGQSASTTSASTQTAVNYTGRGVLTKCFLMEKTSGGTTNYSALLKITIDGNVVYNQSATLTRESQLHVVVGNQAVYGTDLIGIIDDDMGLPFNKSCKIEYASDGTITTTVAWKIKKKL